MECLNQKISFPVSKRTIKKVLIEDFNINTRRKNRYVLNENFFDKIDAEEKSYILGFIAADGYVDDNTNNIKIFSNDLDILEKIKQAIEFTGDIRATLKGGFENSKEGYCIDFTSYNIRKALNKLGIHSKKSLTFNIIPQQIPDQLKRHFLRGYFDGDGSITAYQRTYIKNNKQYIYNKMICTIIATEPLIYKIIEEFKIEHYSISQSKTKELKYLQISAKNELKNFYKLLYENSNIYLNRKKQKWSNNIESL